MPSWLSVSLRSSLIACASTDITARSAKFNVHSASSATTTHVV